MAKLSALKINDSLNDGDGRHVRKRKRNPN
ncbi:hypothetical protein FHY33_004178 [Xanthomonas arboricola]|nr:hypothetical protein [Xanthomonas campestris]